MISASDEVFRGGAAFSFPVGDMFGIQADLTALDAFGETAVGGAAHFFTRDPNSYLLGVYGGYVDAGPANIWYIGPEAELYLDNISIEAVGGVHGYQQWRRQRILCDGQGGALCHRKPAPVGWGQHGCQF